jgi:hypothetical protein
MVVAASVASMVVAFTAITESTPVQCGRAFPAIRGADEEEHPMSKRPLLRKTTTPTISQHKIASLIYLTGIQPTGFTVVLNGYAGCEDIWVPNMRVGHAIVSTMRGLAREKPELFPNSKLEPSS